MRELSEVVDELLADLNGVFEKPMRPLPRGIKITRSRKLALWMSDLGPMPVLHFTLGTPPGVLWCDKLENASGAHSSEYRERCGTEKWQGIRQEICKVEAHLMKQLDKIGMVEFTETATAYCKVITLARTMALPPDGFWDALEKVLLASAIPCGCKRKWPESPLIVYWPHESKPVWESIGTTG